MFELADDIEEIKTTCKCGKKASINARISSDGNVITEGNQILIGGDDIYRSMCRKDWKESVRKQSAEHEERKT